LPSPSTYWIWFPPFHRWFPSWYRNYFRSKGIYLCLGSFTTSFSWWPFKYGVWTFKRLFWPIWFCKWLRSFFQSMLAHCSKSCSTIGIMFVFCISIPIIGEIVWKHTFHHD
jgi:hypothetical protein